MKKTYEQHMDKALEFAKKAYNQGEVPIGAVVVDVDGAIIGRGYNTVEQHHTQTAHAEMQALKEAAQIKKNWRLEGCTLYVTLEPCSMCFYATKLSRIKALYYGAPSPLFGFRLDKDCFLSLYNSDALFINGGIREEESKQILKQFFEKKRNKSGNSKSKHNQS